ncbi:hypothetical protein [Streptomyces sp. NPDC014656]|uniref:hypothetical protein n=1 Tax=Streptomyces sp. NPDC014656 TaxID=3364878 RepID=UPI0036F67D55
MSKKAVIVGFGATGRTIASSPLRRADVEIVGAADQDPRVAGQDLGVLLGGAANGVVVVRDPAGEVTAGGDYRILGEEQVVGLRSSVGFDSFLSTIAAAVNASTAVVEAPPVSCRWETSRPARSRPRESGGRPRSGPRLLGTETETRKPETSRSPKGRLSRLVRRTDTGAGGVLPGMP